METATEPMATEHKPASNGVLSDANSADVKAKRKSVSFVDEKLIMDALNSAAVSNGNENVANGKPAPKPHLARSNSDKPNGGYHNHHQKSQYNGRGGPAPFSNGKRYQNNNGAANGHSKGNYHKQSANGATNGAAKNNAVIVYYNDPQADINVDQLLTKPVAESTPKPEANSYNNNGDKQQHHNNRNQVNYVPKNAAQFNGHNKHGMANGAKANANGNGNHPAKFADNWRQMKGLRMDHPQFNQVKTINGHSYNGGSANGGAGKHNGHKAYNKAEPPRTTNGKTNGTFEKVTPKSEPITIYYSTPEISEVIEQNLKKLQLNGAQVEQTNSDTSSEKPQSDNGQLDGGDKKEAEQTAASAATAVNGNATESSQENVINGSQSADTKMEVDSMPPPPPAPVNGDHYDVISGGVPIEAPVLPTDGANHAVRCTLVSHPGHFYVKFVNAQHEEQLATMNHFYNSDEHIDLSVDVLKAGQYFAGARLKPSDANNKEWIRVQLLHIESPELINCLLIDEGCFGVFKISDLQPLYNQFRSVPKQAIRASLAGVIPKEIDWLPKQALEFKNLVTDRQFHTGQQQFDQKAFDEKQSLEIELYFTEQDGELAGKSVADIAVEREIASKK